MIFFWFLQFFCSTITNELECANRNIFLGQLFVTDKEAPDHIYSKCHEDYVADLLRQLFSLDKSKFIQIPKEDRYNYKVEEKNGGIVDIFSIKKESKTVNGIMIFHKKYHYDFQDFVSQIEPKNLWQVFYIFSKIHIILQMYINMLANVLFIPKTIGGQLKDQASKYSEQLFFTNRIVKIAIIIYNGILDHHNFENFDQVINQILSTDAIIKGFIQVFFETFFREVLCIQDRIFWGDSIETKIKNPDTEILMQQEHHNLYSDSNKTNIKINKEYNTKIGKKCKEILHIEDFRFSTYTIENINNFCLYLLQHVLETSKNEVINVFADPNCSYSIINIIDKYLNSSRANIELIKLNKLNSKLKYVDSLVSIYNEYYDYRTFTLLTCIPKGKRDYSKKTNIVVFLEQDLKHENYIEIFLQKFAKNAKAFRKYEKLIVNILRLNYNYLKFILITGLKKCFEGCTIDVSNTLYKGSFREEMYVTDDDVIDNYIRAYNIEEKHTEIIEKLTQLINKYHDDLIADESQFDAGIAIEKINTGNFINAELILSIYNNTESQANDSVFKNLKIKKEHLDTYMNKKVGQELWCYDDKIVPSLKKRNTAHTTCVTCKGSKHNIKSLNTFNMLENIHISAKPNDNLFGVDNKVAKKKQEDDYIKTGRKPKNKGKTKVKKEKAKKNKQSKNGKKTQDESSNENFLDIIAEDSENSESSNITFYDCIESLDEEEKPINAIRGSKNTIKKAKGSVKQTKILVNQITDPIGTVTVSDANVTKKKTNRKKKLKNTKVSVTSASECSSLDQNKEGIQISKRINEVSYYNADQNVDCNYAHTQDRNGVSDETNLLNFESSQNGNIARNDSINLHICHDKEDNSTVQQSNYINVERNLNLGCKPKIKLNNIPSCSQTKIKDDDGDYFTEDSNRLEIKTQESILSIEKDTEKTSTKIQISCLQDNDDLLIVRKQTRCIPDDENTLCNTSLVPNVSFSLNSLQEEQNVSVLDFHENDERKIKNQMRKTKENTIKNDAIPEILNKDSALVKDTDEVDQNSENYIGKFKAVGSNGKMSSNKKHSNFFISNNKTSAKISKHQLGRFISHILNRHQPELTKRKQRNQEVKRVHVIQEQKNLFEVPLKEVKTNKVKLNCDQNVDDDACKTNLNHDRMMFVTTPRYDQLFKDPNNIFVYGKGMIYKARLNEIILEKEEAVSNKSCHNINQNRVEKIGNHTKQTCSIYNITAHNEYKQEATSKLESDSMIFYDKKIPRCDINDQATSKNMHELTDLIRYCSPEENKISFENKKTNNPRNLYEDLKPFKVKGLKNISIKNKTKISSLDSSKTIAVINEDIYLPPKGDNATKSNINIKQPQRMIHLNRSQKKLKRLGKGKLIYKSKKSIECKSDDLYEKKQYEELYEGIQDKTCIDGTSKIKSSNINSTELYVGSESNYPKDCDYENVFINMQSPQYVQSTFGEWNQNNYDAEEYTYDVNHQLQQPQQFIYNIWQENINSDFYTGIEKPLFKKNYTLLPLPRTLNNPHPRYLEILALPEIDTRQVHIQ